MPSYKFIFLGGLFCEEQREFILRNSVGVVQNAADVLQKNIVIGLDSISSSGVTVINLPFVGSYPKRFRVRYFPAIHARVGQHSQIHGFGFLNITLVKLVSRFVAATKALWAENRGGEVILFVYSAHLPFVLSSLIFRFTRPSVKICLVLPDLPEYMGGGGFLYSIFKRIDAAIFYSLAKRIDYFVVLTEKMIFRLGVDEKRAVVIEGVAPDMPPEVNFKPVDSRSFLYTGTLARRYGVVDLIDAFEKLEGRDVELWICGDGDSRDYICSAAKRDRRIRYFGQLERGDVVKLQGRATVLVNPRPPEGEFTKYSFPSKIMEYMVSGRPVIMYKLDGVPKEYSPYYISPEGVGVDWLAATMRRTLQMSEDRLGALGEAARQFVLAEKSARIQARKILNLVTQGELC